MWEFGLGGLAVYQALAWQYSVAVIFAKAKILRHLGYLLQSLCHAGFTTWRSLAFSELLNFNPFF